MSDESSTCSIYSYNAEHSEFEYQLYSQYMNPTITVNNPALIPAISFPPFAPLFFPVALALAELPVAVPVELEAAVAVPVLKVCPRLGNLTFPSTNHPPAVDEGQAGAVREGL